MIRKLLIDLDSVMNLYKIYNLPIYNHNIGKSLQYVLEGTNLAITKDNRYAAILSDTEFLQYTLAYGHFCALNTGLCHIDMSQWCLTALFFKDSAKIDNPNVQATHLLQLVHLDYLTFKATEGGKDLHMLIITDHFMRYAQAVVTSSQTAKCTAQALWVPICSPQWATR